ncbi:hypothetical protein HY415_02290 [Candidatus Kaiserbacteria bacterium]|nr:hypothetical protein [Candidatus Kaiserbacteria bacterium]
MSRAFTLIESVIVVALFIVVMLGVMQLYIVFGRVIAGQSASISAVLGGSDIIDAARSAGLPARSVVAAHTFSSVSYSSGTTTAIFELPSIDSSGALIPNASDYIGIYASSTEAYRVIDAAQDSARVSGKKLLTNSLDALSFTYDSASFPSVTNVTVDATTSALARGQVASVHLRERIYLRNL